MSVFQNLLGGLGRFFQTAFNPLSLLIGGASLLFATLFNSNSNNQPNSVLQNSLATPPQPPPPPPVQPTSTSFGGPKDQLIPYLTGIGNADGRYQPDTRIYGTYKVSPVKAARVITEISGQDQYLMALFSLGYGPLDISEIKIGDKSIDEYEDVQYEVREGTTSDDPITIYTQDVEETNIGVQLLYNQAITRTAGQIADRLSIDVMFPNGLYFDDSGTNTRNTAVVSIQVHYRQAGSSDPWVLAGTIGAIDATGSVVRRGLSWAVDRDLYEVRLTRQTLDSTVDYIVDASWWSILRAFDSNTQPIVQRKDRDGNAIGTAYIAVRIKASDQLNGDLDNLTCIAKSKLAVWNGSSWDAPAITNNPAWIFADMLTGTWCKRAISKSKLDTTQLEAWADFCDDKGFTFNFVYDTKTTVLEALKQVTSVGRASPGKGANGKWTVVIDDEKSTPVTFFSPTNSKEFEGQIKWIDQPEALNVRFVNPDAEWQTDERVVYDDGYDSSSANIRETISLLGVTDSDQAWKLGRYYLAQARLRRERYYITTDFENLKCRRGDLVYFNHDVPQFGVASCRIKSLVINGSGDITGIVLTDKVPATLGAMYDVSIRMSNGSTINRIALGDGTNMDTLPFTVAIPVATSPKPAAGDLVLFGGYISCLVENIEYLDELSARITLIDYVPGLYTADSGTIPEHDPQITIQPEIVTTIAKPVVVAVRSDELVLFRDTDGALRTRVQVTIQPVASNVTFHQYQFRINGAGAYGATYNVPAQGGVIYIDGVQDGSTVDIRIRNVSNLGVLSEWTEITGHYVIGKTTPPPDVPFLARQSDYIVWKYNEALLGVPVPKDFAGFRLKIATGGTANWNNATLIDNLTTGTQIPVSSLPAGEYTFLVKAVDVANNESVNAATLRANFGSPIINNVLYTEDQHPTFPGTITNGTVDGGELLADETGGVFWTNDSAPFWTSDESSLFWSTTYEMMTYGFTFTPPSGLSGDMQFSLDYDIQGDNFAVEYRTQGQSLFWNTYPGADDEPFWTGDSDPFWDADGPYTLFPGAIDIARESVDIKVATPSSQWIRGIISQLTAVLDVPDVKENLNSILISSAGTRLPITQSYRAITAVNLTINNSALYPDAFVSHVIDMNVAGPLIKIFDLNGDPVDGIVSAVIQGY